MAKGSCGELRGMLYAREDLRYIAPADVEETRSIAALAARLPRCAVTGTFDLGPSTCDGKGHWGTDGR